MTRLLSLSLLVLLGGAVGCTNADATREALRKHGFKNVTTGGSAFFSCGKDDTYSTEFTATNSAGESVEGVVCCGLFKSCTVRF